MADGSATQDIIYNARPTLRFNGEFDVRASTLVQAMRMCEREGGLRSLEMGLSNWASTQDQGAEIAFDAAGPIQLGAKIEVYLGEVDRPREVFRGQITAIESIRRRGSPPELRVFAEDALQAARMARRSKLYVDKSPADVVRAVASELGLQPTITALTSPTATWAQIDETDLAFLRRLLARFDADAQIVGTDLHVSPRGEVQRQSISLNAEEDLRAVSVFADLADQVTAVTVRGWDAVQGKAVKATASSGTNMGPGRGRDGATVLRDAIGERPENLGHSAVRTREEAQALAEAAYDRRARAFLRAVGTTEGNPNLRVGVKLALSGIGQRYDNDYYVIETRHLYDLDEGYRTEFVAECAYLGGG
jgi:phage protein D